MSFKTFTLALFMFGISASGVFAQTDSLLRAYIVEPVTDTSSVADGPSFFSRLDLGLFGEIGQRSGGDFAVINLGLHLKYDILTFSHGNTAVFVRAGASAGTWLMQEAGAGYYWSKRFFASISWAVLAESIDDRDPALMFTIGAGHPGFLLELNFFLYLSPETSSRFNDLTATYTRSQFKPTAITLRLGHTF